MATYDVTQGRNLSEYNSLVIAFEYNGDNAEYLSRRNYSSDTAIRINYDSNMVAQLVGSDERYYQAYEIPYNTLSLSDFLTSLNQSTSNVWLHDVSGHCSTPEEFIGTSNTVWKYKESYTVPMNVQGTPNINVTIYIFNIYKEYKSRFDIWIGFGGWREHDLGVELSPNNGEYPESTGHCKDSNVICGDGAAIIEMSSSGSSNYGMGLNSSSVSVTSPVSNVRNYSFTSISGTYDFTSGSQGSTAMVYGGQSKIFGIHNVAQSSTYSLSPFALGTGEYNNSCKYKFANSGGYGSWAYMEGSNGNKYYAITCRATTSNHTYTTLSVSTGKQYTFNMHTYSQATYDGIIISTSTLSSTVTPSTANSNIICSCHGNNVSNTYTYVPSSSGTVYIYYHTNASGGVGTNTANGDLEVIEETVTRVTVTLNKQSGTGGDSSVGVVPNASASSCPTVSVPTRSGYNFLGYYSTYNGGTQYIDSSGNWVHSYDYTSGTTFYAHWENPITYEINYPGSFDYFYIWCSNYAQADTSTRTTQTVTVSSSGYSCKSGSVTLSSVTANFSPSGKTPSLTSSGKTLSIPSGVNANGSSSQHYTVTVNLTSPSGGSSGSAYVGSTKTVTFNLHIYANEVDGYGAITVNHTTPVSLSAAGQTYTMSPTYSQIVYWNNGGTSSNSTGGSLSYSVVTSKTGYSLSSNKVTVTENTSTSARNGYVVRITVSANGQTGTKDVTFNQPAATIEWGDISITSTYTYDNFAASGATKTPKNSITYSQTKYVNGNANQTVTSGATVTYVKSGTLPSGFSTGTSFSSNGSVTWASRGTTTGTARDAKSYLSVSVSLNGKTATASCESCLQEANSLTWDNPPTPSHTTPVSLNKAGQTYTMNATVGSQTGTYTSGSTTTSTPTLSYTVQTAKDGYSLNTSTHVVTVTNNESTSARNGFVVRITASGNSKTSYKDVTFNQPAGTISYAKPVVTAFIYDDFPASGDTKVPVADEDITYSQGYTWNGVAGSGGYILSGGTLSFSTTGTLPSGFSTGSNFSTTGRVTWANRETTEGDARDAKNNLLVTVTLNGVSSDATACSRCRQLANTVTWSNLGTINHDTPISFTAIGGEYGMSPTISDQTGTYSSGSTTTYSPTFSYGVITEKEGFSRFSYKVYASNNTTTSARNGFVVRITATGNGGKTATKDITFNQAAGSRVYAEPVITSFTYSDCAASGGTKTPTVTYTQEYTWNGVSGSGSTVTSGGQLTYTVLDTLPYGFSTDNNFSSTGSVTWESRGTEIGSIKDAKNNLWVAVYLNGEISNGYRCTSCRQLANAVETLSLELGSSTIDYNGTTTGTLVATYTSGDDLDVSSAFETEYSTNPTGIVSISK